ncbi:DsbC family protein [Halorhodospira halophila]|uniref:Thiol:disulfide interchange protein n=1 Tax=Halorhodospira halophila (strain DSM 244 / SL1) TaxID=349124 RepID=A1WYE6_HALHL|nr:DsbC family protein [Halorhodospira halophila]ABM62708.1 Protein-disulfide isomerase-like protein [Halorhodospira halophila SL1]MBK1728389.1 hypothetical protein [Halorhodospira halophila]
MRRESTSARAPRIRTARRAARVLVFGGCMGAATASVGMMPEEIAETLEAMPEEDLIVYEPEEGEAEHSVTVFTDVTCPHCQDLHAELDAYLEQGIRVRYAAFALSDASRALMDQVWCSDDRHEALEAAKSGEEPEAGACDASPVEDHQEVAQQIGVPGTPTMATPGGELSFRLTPEDLADLLEQEAH